MSLWVSKSGSGITRARSEYSLLSLSGSILSRSYLFLGRSYLFLALSQRSSQRIRPPRTTTHTIPHSRNL